MKVLFQIIVFSLLSNVIFAQTEKIDRLPGLLYQGKYSNAQFFQKADYIIEGEVIRREIALSKDSTIINEQVIFEISEVYKGDISKGTVEIIVESGKIHLSGKQLGVTIEYNTDNPTLAISGKMILFCKKSSAKRLFEKPDIDNLTTLALLDDKHSAGLYYSRDYRYNFELFGLNHQYFKTKQDFYQYLSNFQGTVLPEEAGIKKKALLKSASVDEYGQMQENIKSLIETCNYFKANRPTLKSVTAAGDINFSVTNQKVVYSASKWYYEFDVNANSSLSGCYLQNIFLELDYSKTAFGANISASSKVSPTKLGVYNNLYYNISHMDMTDSRVLIILSASDASGSFNRGILPTSSTSVFHVKMEILPNLNPLSSGLAFYSDPNSFSLGFSYTTTANAGWSSVIDYANVNYNAIVPINVYSLAPVIGGISPLTVNAGCEDVITITGSNFGTSNGKVFFKNADDGGQTYIEEFDQTTNIVSWSNTLIKVKVPSFQYNPATKESNSAGTGPIIVKSSTGAQNTSTQTLTIKYSLLNVGNPPYQRVDRLFLAKMNCVNGIEFSIGDAFRYNRSAELVVLRALQDWSLKMGITLTVERDANNNVIYRDNSYLSTKNLIYLDQTYTNVMATSVGPVGNVSGPYYNSNEYYRANADIRINPNKNWHYGIGDNVYAGEYDFYHAILHELGHALGITHVNDPDDLMYWQYNQTVTHLASTRKNLNNSPNSIVGALRIVNESKALNWTNPAIAKLGSANPQVPAISTSGPVSFCSGSVTLTSSAASNNKWYESGNLYSSNRSITVSNTGDFYVTTTLNACTIKSSTTSVAVCPSITYYAINNASLSSFFRKVNLNNTTINRPTHYMASENPNFSGASWISYNNAPSFTLSRGKGRKTVYLKVKNSAGVSPVLSDKILYKPLFGIGIAVSDSTFGDDANDDFFKKATISEIDYEFSEESSFTGCGFVAYPIPCVDKINIVVPAEIKGHYKITIVDMSGVTVLLDNIYSEMKTIDISCLLKGTYIMRLVGNEKIFVKPFIKQ